MLAPANSDLKEIVNSFLLNGIHSAIPQDIALNDDLIWLKEACIHQGQIYFKGQSK